MTPRSMRNASLAPVVAAFILSACASTPGGRLGLIADIQYAQKETAGKRRYRESLAKLYRALDHMNQENLVAIVQLGDLIDGNRSPEATRADLDAVLQSLAVSRAKVNHVIGNHGLVLPRAELLERLEIARGYRSFTHGSWRFILLDTYDLSVLGRGAEDPRRIRAAAWLGAHPSSEHPQAQSWNGGLGQEQLDWLRAELEAAARRAERVLVFGHNPIHPMACDAIHLVWNHAELRHILESSGRVAAYFSGHDHSGGYHHDRGIHHVTLRAMVEAPSAGNAYAIVVLRARAIEIRGHGNVISRVLKLSASKD